MLASLRGFNFGSAMSDIIANHLEYPAYRRRTSARNCSMAAGDSYRALADDYANRARQEIDSTKQKELQRLAEEYRRLADKAGSRARD